MSINWIANVYTQVHSNNNMDKSACKEPIITTHAPMSVVTVLAITIDLVSKLIHH